MSEYPRIETAMNEDRTIRQGSHCPHCGEWVSLHPASGWSSEPAQDMKCSHCGGEYTMALVPVENADEP